MVTVNAGNTKEKQTQVTAVSTAGSGGGDGLSHTGGHRLIEEAENIINNR